MVMYSEVYSLSSQNMVDFYSQAPRNRCDLPAGRMALDFNIGEYNVYLDNNYIGRVSLNEAMEWVACGRMPKRNK